LGAKGTSRLVMGREVGKRAQSSPTLLRAVRPRNDLARDAGDLPVPPGPTRRAPSGEAVEGTVQRGPDGLVALPVAASTARKPRMTFRGDRVAELGEGTTGLANLLAQRRVWARVGRVGLAVVFVRNQRSG